MNKKALIFIIIAILFISVGLIISFTKGKNESTNEIDNGNEKESSGKHKKGTENLPPYEKEELYDILAKYSSELYSSKKYDKCVKKEDGSCFVSLESLEKDYGKDITKFKDEKRGGCLLDTSGVTFYANDPKTPFSFVLEGCEFSTGTEEPEPSQLGE